MRSLSMGFASAALTASMVCCVVTACSVPALEQFPPPETPGAYTLSKWRAHHYLDPYVVQAVRHAAEVTLSNYGPAVMPPEVCDGSTVDGGTPVGRHPAGAHSGGRNLDLTYYMLRPVKSRIVCPSFGDNHCTGPPTDLDVRRQASFLARLVTWDLHRSRRLRLVAVDGRVREVLERELDGMGRTGELPWGMVQQAKAVLEGSVVDDGKGWFRYHHNHAHLRFW